MEHDCAVVASCQRASPLPFEGDENDSHDVDFRFLARRSFGLLFVNADCPIYPGCRRCRQAQNPSSGESLE